MRIEIKEEKRCPRLLYRNCIIISGIFERRSSKPRLIFASYKRHVPPICRAEVGSKIKVCHPLYPARNRATCCTTFKINSPYSSPHIRSIFLFQFNSPTFHRSYENLCRVRVARKFISRSNIEFRFPLLPLYFCYPDGIPSRFPISLARIEVHECRVDRSIRITLPAARTMPRIIFSVRNSGREFSGIEADWELFFFLSLRWPLANGTAVCHAFVHKECAYHTSVYLSSYRPLSPSPSSSRFSGSLSLESR